MDPNPSSMGLDAIPLPSPHVCNYPIFLLHLQSLPLLPNNISGHSVLSHLSKHVLDPTTPSSDHHPLPLPATTKLLSCPLHFLPSHSLQSGFCPNHSTKIALSKIISDLEVATSNQRFSDLIVFGLQEYWNVDFSRVQASLWLLIYRLRCLFSTSNWGVPQPWSQALSSPPTLHNFLFPGNLSHILNTISASMTLKFATQQDFSEPQVYVSNCLLSTQLAHRHLTFNTSNLEFMPWTSQLALLQCFSSQWIAQTKNLVILLSYCSLFCLLEGPIICFPSPWAKPPSSVTCDGAIVSISSSSKQYPHTPGFSPLDVPALL